jgi:transcriptional regulator with XRE-family HTH domain
MKQHELQQLKMAWLAAEEAGDRQAQMTLLRDHPDAQDALIDFIAAYRASGPAVAGVSPLPLTQRAFATALNRVFAPPVAASLRELRGQQGLSMVQAARGLRLGVDVWKKFEDGLIDLLSLSERQLERLARYFHISGEQFGQLLLGSQPTQALNRRQTAQSMQGAHSQPEQQKQSFAEAIARSAMSPSDREEWLEEE